jgi:hypothetical protein
MKFVRGGDGGDGGSTERVRPDVHGVMKSWGLLGVALSALLLSIPAVSQASDPLLSGYGGPGGDQQTVLGSKLIGTSGGPPSSGAGASTPAANQSLVIVTPSTTAASAGSPASWHGGTAARLTSPPQARLTSTPQRVSSHAATGKPVAVTAAPIAYPSRDASAGGLPLSSGELALVLLGLTTLLLMGMGLRRFAPEGSDHGGGAY